MPFFVRLCSYFTGVTAVLQSLGIINNNTRLAGSSGGALTAAAICSNVPAATQQLATNFNIAAACRPSLACKGYLDTVVRKYSGALLPENVTEQCKRRLFVTVTEARPHNLTDPPQVTCSLFCTQWRGDLLKYSMLVQSAQCGNGIPKVPFLHAWPSPLITWGVDTRDPVAFVTRLTSSGLSLGAVVGSNGQKLQSAVHYVHVARATSSA